MTSIPTTPKISLITLGVADLPRSRAFYVALGWPVSGGDGDDFVMFGESGTRLALFPRHCLAADAGVDPAGDGFRGCALAHNVASPEAVRAVIDLAVASGAILVKPAADTFWGGYSGYFADPDGHLWEVAHNPFTDLT